MKNYRLQDGCWNCKKVFGHKDEYLEIQWHIHCSLTGENPDEMEEVYECGICDLHEKEEE